ncbi:MAG: BamA/TamA family outer membrane protein [Hyalangium sp.]|uniref:BamA/TamA family outer membrane protein n=1 Tax=Hyalangium sp. TaxID=2028555 RepID=UPI003899E0A4
MDVALFRHRLRTLALLSLALACACAAPKPRPDALEVKDLKIEGTDQVREKDIKSKILTTDTPWWEPLWPFDKGPSYFDPNAWQADLRRIERYYQARGYYQAQVVSDTVKPEGKDKVELIAQVREGPPTKIGNVVVSGMEALPQEHQHRATLELPLEAGDIFEERNWEGVKELIQGRLRELGYAEAEVGGEVRVDVATHLATVDIQVQPGPRYKFGNIFVATDANPQVAPKRIIEQAQGSVVKGEWYSESALAEAQARVFAMGVFGAVKVNRGAPDKEAATVPVVVDVREAPLRSVRLGGGLGVDAARQEGRVLGEWTNRNIFGGLRRLTVKGRLGYAFLPSIYSSDKHGLIFNLTNEFEQPRFLFRDLRLQASLSAEKGLEQAYSFIGGRLRTGVIWQPHPDLSIFPAYNLEVYQLSGQVGPSDRQQGVPLITLGCSNTTSRTAPCNIRLSYLETTVTWDRRDDKNEPRAGYYMALSVQGGGSLLLGDFTYVRLQPDLRYYQSFGLDQQFTLAGKVRAGSLVPFRNKATGLKQSSIVNRFFSGGGNSMRGFNYQRLSPQAPIDPTDPAAGTVPVGGNSLFESTLEARYRLTQSLALASFWDTGFVGAGSLDVNPLRDGLYHALGLGLRYLTVVGPIRVDIARRLNIGPPLPVQGVGYTYPRSGTCFGLGGKKTLYAGAPEGLCTFQLSIGEAF